MSSLRTFLRVVALGVATLQAMPAWSGGPADEPPGKVPAPPKPDVNVRIAVHAGVPKETLLEKKHGHLARKDAGNGQREGSSDPGPPQGETGDGRSKGPHQ
jgi:hypothetical protein